MNRRTDEDTQTGINTNIQMHRWTWSLRDTCTDRKMRRRTDALTDLDAPSSWKDDNFGPIKQVGYAEQDLNLVNLLTAAQINLPHLELG